VKSQRTWLEPNNPDTESYIAVNMGREDYERGSFTVNLADCGRRVDCCSGRAGC